MKKLLGIFLAMVLLCSSIPALAADVSGFEEHAGIDLTPFKDDFYTAKFDEMAYTATISAPSIEIVTQWPMYNGFPYEDTVSFYLNIQMHARNGVIYFTPEISFYAEEYASVDGFRITMGENRYYVTVEVTRSTEYGCRGHALIGKSLLKEMISSEHPVKFCVGDKTSSTHEFTAAELEHLRRFVNDLETVGLLDSMSDDNVITITNWN